MTRIPLLPGVLLLVGACAGLDLTREVPIQRRWPLDVAREGAALDGSRDRALLVRRFTVGDGYGDEALLWRRRDGFFAASLADRLLAPPAAAVADAARGWLDDGGRWTAVVGEGAQLLPDEVLRGHVVRLYGDLGGEDAPAAVVELQLVLTDVRDAPPTLLHEGTYAARVPMADESGEALVDALGVGLAQAFAAFEAELDG